VLVEVAQGGRTEHSVVEDAAGGVGPEELLAGVELLEIGSQVGDLGPDGGFGSSASPSSTVWVMV